MAVRLRGSLLALADYERRVRVATNRCALCDIGYRGQGGADVRGSDRANHYPRLTSRVGRGYSAVSCKRSNEDPVLAGSELSLDALLAAVEQRNPSLEGMIAAWQAAAQRYPQAIALDDPMFQFTLAPTSIGSSEVEPAYAIQASQKLPWYGKRAARGQVATAEASAAYFDSEEVRVRLREMTQLAFLDYYLAQRNLDLNAQDVSVMRDLRATALTKYQANQVTQQDVLQADVELADLDRKRIELDRTQRIAIARINTLLRRQANAALPPRRDACLSSTRSLRPSNWNRPH